MEKIRDLCFKFLEFTELYPNWSASVQVMKLKCRDEIKKLKPKEKEHLDKYIYRKITKFRVIVYEKYMSILDDLIN